MAIKTWFPTSIYQENLKSKSLTSFNKELKEECYKLRDFDLEGRKWSDTEYVGGYTSFASMAELHEFSSSFMELQKQIDRHVKLFSKHLEYDLGTAELQMTNCWVNIMPALTSHRMHIHPLSVVSGTYYVQVAKDAAGISFEDPRLDKFMAAPPKKTKTKLMNQQFAKYKVKAGQVVLFESWLRHEVPASRSKQDRISISFNYDWV